VAAKKGKTMKHFERNTQEEKIRRWLELCDFSFELSKGGPGEKPSVAQRKAFYKSNSLIKKKSKLNRRVFSQLS